MGTTTATIGKPVYVRALRTWGTVYAASATRVTVRTLWGKLVTVGYAGVTA